MYRFIEEGMSVTFASRFRLITRDKSDFDNDTKDIAENMGILSLDENQEVGPFMI